MGKKLSFTEEKEAFIRAENYKQKLADHEQLVGIWQRNVAAAQRRNEAELQRRRGVLSLEGIPGLALPTYSGSMNAAEFQQAAQSAFDTFVQNNDLEPAERSLVLKVTELAGSNVDITQPSTWKVVLDAVREYLHIELPPAPVAPVNPDAEVEEQVVERPRETEDQYNARIRREAQEEIYDETAAPLREALGLYALRDLTGEEIKLVWQEMHRTHTPLTKENIVRKARLILGVNAIASGEQEKADFLEHMKIEKLTAAEYIQYEKNKRLGVV